MINTLDLIALTPMDVEHQIISYPLTFAKDRRTDVEWKMRFPMFVPPFYSYAIGKANPVAVDVKSFGTSALTDENLRDIVFATFNLRPAAIIEKLCLRNAIYSDTAVYGHFNSRLFPWEDINLYTELRKAAKQYADRKAEN